MYVRHGTKERSNFLELRKAELRRGRKGEFRSRSDARAVMLTKTAIVELCARPQFGTL
jgi:hypothetical protein